MDAVTHGAVTIRSWDDLHSALRNRVESLNISRAVLDDLAGFPSGYSGKLLSKFPVRQIGRVSFELLLAATGAKLVMTDDPAQLEKLRSRYTPRQRASGTMLATKHKKRRGLRGNSKWGRFMNAQRQLSLSKSKRRAIARVAARARWCRQRRQHAKSKVATN